MILTDGEPDRAQLHMALQPIRDIPARTGERELTGTTYGGPSPSPVMGGEYGVVGGGASSLPGAIA